MTAKFDINLDPVGRGTVIVNDQDVSQHVSAMQIYAHHQEPTQVVLRLNSEVKISGEGIVNIVTPSEDLDAQIIDRLRKLDIGKIEDAAMSQLDWGGDKSIGQAVFDSILEALGAESRPGQELPQE